MCGIAGVLWREPRDSIAATLESACDSLRHRGPDDHGIFVDAQSRCGLANTRLAIRDLSPAGHMPMRSRDGRFCITYNGEIYNARELRDELKTHGHEFRSHSDTEVVLAGYAQWGEDVVEHLRGMFAFAIYDGEKIFAARDRLGIKPLYFSARDDAFAFASEIQSLVRTGFVDRQLDPFAVSAFLQMGSVPAPLTIFREVRALEPGYAMVVDRTLRVRIFRYYEFPDAGSGRARELLPLLRDAVHSHLVADVDVGAFLSGGIDSAAIVALASECAPRLTTCTVRFGADEADETQLAHLVAQRFGTNHHEVQITRQDFVDGIGQVTRAMDQPTIDGFNTWFISKAAADLGLKVVLSGLGGDELFGGYPTFSGVRRLAGIYRALGATPASTVIRRVTRSARWRKVAENSREPTLESAYLTYRGLFTRSESEALFPVDVSFVPTDYVAQRTSGGGSGEFVTQAELRTYTANQLLRDADVMSMAHSLELRVPFLDDRLVNETLSWPVEARLTGVRKKALRDALRGVVPGEILQRREKTGFTFPMQQWLASSEARHLWDWRFLTDFNRASLNKVKEDFDTGRAHWSRPWSLIALNEWQRQLHA